VSDTSWCDKVAATPGVGVTLDWSYIPSQNYLEAIRPITANWVERDKDRQAFVIDLQDAFALSVTAHDGFNYQFNSSQFYTEFRHRVRFQPRSAGPPTAEVLSRPLPFTQALPEISKRLVDATRYVTDSTGKNRKLRRIGIVTNALVAEDEAPPGIIEFIEYIKRPWKGSADGYSIDITSKLPRRSKDPWFDRCKHTVIKEENNDGLLSIRLDYARSFDPVKDLSVALLDGLLEKTRHDALGYFEDIGKGGRFDEDIIAESE
jgi:hypothetical protein